LASLGLSAAETAALDGVTTVVEIPAGTALYREGSSGKQLAWIIDGTASVTRSGVVVARVGAGDVVGEGTMLHTHERCSADVIAETPMTIAVLSQRDWQIAAYRAPTLAERLFELALDREPARAA
jgi:CRP-like cAMP-binding protein